MYALIYKDPISKAKDQPLRVKTQDDDTQESDVKFFIPPILDYADFRQSSCKKFWSITFFKGSAFEQTLGVNIHDEEPEVSHCLAKAAWIYSERSISEGSSDLLQRASQFLRKSATLSGETVNHLTRRSSLLTDRNGVVFFTEQPTKDARFFGEDRFKRIVLELCLALAYRNVMLDFMQQLTRTIKSKQTEQTLTLYESILYFNAGDYFRYPVNLENHELFPAWKHIAEHFKLQELNCELTEQLSHVALLLQKYRERIRHEQEESKKEALAKAEKSRREQEIKTERAFNRRSARLAFALGVLSLLSLLALVELTPEHFQAAYQNWLEPLISKSE